MTTKYYCNSEQKLTPIFRIGDTIIAKDGTYIEKEPFHIDKIDDDCYWDGENTILVCNQEEFEIFEQKPVDKVESKFKVGDWVVTRNGWPTQITRVYTDGYSNSEHGFFKKIYEDELRLWTIQDAKDGDVLAYPDGSITLFKYMDENIYMAHVLWVDGHIELNNSCAISNVHPATKEQRDLLFQKMKEAGYEWNAEKKELKKIEQKPTAWSEEDIENISMLIDLVEAKEESMEVKIELSTWLKSLKDKVQPQNGYNPYKEVVESIAEMCKHYDKASHSGLRDFYDNVKVKCKDAKEYDSLYPQSTWKPSDEQMDALEHFVRSIGESGFASPYDSNTKLVYSLLSELKKLKG